MAPARNGTPAYRRIQAAILKRIEDAHLKPGDLLFVPQNTISKIRRYLPAQSFGMYWNPAQF